MRLLYLIALAFAAAVAMPPPLPLCTAPTSVMLGSDKHTFSFVPAHPLERMDMFIQLAMPFPNNVYYSAKLYSPAAVAPTFEFSEVIQKQHVDNSPPTSSKYYTVPLDMCTFLPGDWIEISFWKDPTSDGTFSAALCYTVNDTFVGARNIVTLATTAPTEVMITATHPAVLLVPLDEGSADPLREINIHIDYDCKGDTSQCLFSARPGLTEAAGTCRATPFLGLSDGASQYSFVDPNTPIVIFPCMLQTFAGAQYIPVVFATTSDSITANVTVSNLAPQPLPVNGSVVQMLPRGVNARYLYTITAPAGTEMIGVDIFDRVDVSIITRMVMDPHLLSPYACATGARGSYDIRTRDCRNNAIPCKLRRSLCVLSEDSVERRHINGQDPFHRNTTGQTTWLVLVEVASDFVESRSPSFSIRGSLHSTIADEIPSTPLALDTPTEGAVSQYLYAHYRIDLPAVPDGGSPRDARLRVEVMMHQDAPNAANFQFDSSTDDTRLKVTHSANYVPHVFLRYGRPAGSLEDCLEHQTACRSYQCILTVPRCLLGDGSWYVSVTNWNREFIDLMHFTITATLESPTPLLSGQVVSDNASPHAAHAREFSMSVPSFGLGRVSTVADIPADAYYYPDNPFFPLLWNFGFGEHVMSDGYNNDLTPGFSQPFVCDAFADHPPVSLTRAHDTHIPLRAGTTYFSVFSNQFMDNAFNVDDGRHNTQYNPHYFELGLMEPFRIQVDHVPAAAMRELLLDTPTSFTVAEPYLFFNTSALSDGTSSLSVRIDVGGYPDGDAIPTFTPHMIQLPHIDADLPMSGVITTATNQLQVPFVRIYEFNDHDHDQAAKDAAANFILSPADLAAAGSEGAIVSVMNPQLSAHAIVFTVTATLLPRRELVLGKTTIAQLDGIQPLGAHTYTFDIDAQMPARGPYSTLVIEITSFELSFHVDTEYIRIGARIGAPLLSRDASWQLCEHVRFCQLRLNPCQLAAGGVLFLTVGSDQPDTRYALNLRAEEPVPLDLTGRSEVAISDTVNAMHGLFGGSTGADAFHPLGRTRYDGLYNGHNKYYAVTIPDDVPPGAELIFRVDNIGTSNFRVTYSSDSSDDSFTDFAYQGQWLMGNQQSRRGYIYPDGLDIYSSTPGQYSGQPQEGDRYLSTTADPTWYSDEQNLGDVECTEDCGGGEGGPVEYFGPDSRSLNAGAAYYPFGVRPYTNVLLTTTNSHDAPGVLPGSNQDFLFGNDWCGATEPEWAWTLAADFPHFEELGKSGNSKPLNPSANGVLRVPSDMIRRNSTYYLGIVGMAEFMRFADRRAPMQVSYSLTVELRAREPQEFGAVGGGAYEFKGTFEEHVYADISSYPVGTLIHVETPASFQQVFGEEFITEMSVLLGGPNDRASAASRDALFHGETDMGDPPHNARLMKLFDSQTHLWVALHNPVPRTPSIDPSVYFYFHVELPQSIPPTGEWLDINITAFTSKPSPKQFVTTDSTVHFILDLPAGSFPGEATQIETYLDAAPADFDDYLMVAWQTLPLQSTAARFPLWEDQPGPGSLAGLGAGIPTCRLFVKLSSLHGIFAFGNGQLVHGSNDDTPECDSTFDLSATKFLIGFDWSHCSSSLPAFNTMHVRVVLPAVVDLGVAPRWYGDGTDTYPPVAPTSYVFTPPAGVSSAWADENSPAVFRFTSPNADVVPLFGAPVVIVSYTDTSAATEWKFAMGRGSGTAFAVISSVTTTSFTLPVYVSFEKLSRPKEAVAPATQYSLFVSNLNTGAVSLEFTVFWMEPEVWSLKGATTSYTKTLANMDPASENTPWRVRVLLPDGFADGNQLVSVDFTGDTDFYQPIIVSPLNSQYQLAYRDDTNDGPTFKGGDIYGAIIPPQYGFTEFFVEVRFKADVDSDGFSATLDVKLRTPTMVAVGATPTGVDIDPYDVLAFTFPEPQLRLPAFTIALTNGRARIVFSHVALSDCAADFISLHQYSVNPIYLYPEFFLTNGGSNGRKSNLYPPCDPQPGRMITVWVVNADTGNTVTFTGNLGDAVEVTPNVPLFVHPVSELLATSTFFVDFHEQAPAWVITVTSPNPSSSMSMSMSVSLETWKPLSCWSNGNQGPLSALSVRTILAPTLELSSSFMVGDYQQHRVYLDSTAFDANIIQQGYFSRVYFNAYLFDTDATVLVSTEVNNVLTLDASGSGALSVVLAPTRIKSYKLVLPEGLSSVGDINMHVHATYGFARAWIQLVDPRSPILPDGNGVEFDTRKEFRAHGCPKQRRCPSSPILMFAEDCDYKFELSDPVGLDIMVFVESRDTVNETAVDLTFTYKPIEVVPIALNSFHAITDPRAMANYWVLDIPSSVEAPLIRIQWLSVDAYDHWFVGYIAPIRPDCDDGSLSVGGARQFGYYYVDAASYRGCRVYITTQGAGKLISTMSYGFASDAYSNLAPPINRPPTHLPGDGTPHRDAFTTEGQSMVYSVDVPVGGYGVVEVTLDDPDAVSALRTMINGRVENDVVRQCLVQTENQVFCSHEDTTRRAAHRVSWEEGGATQYVSLQFAGDPMGYSIAYYAVDPLTPGEFVWQEGPGARMVPLRGMHVLLLDNFGEEASLKAGDVVDVVMASNPGFFTIEWLENGVLQPLPVGACFDHSFDKLSAVPVHGMGSQAQFNAPENSMGTYCKLRIEVKSSKTSIVITELPKILLPPLHVRFVISRREVTPLGNGVPLVVGASASRGFSGAKDNVLHNVLFGAYRAQDEYYDALQYQASGYKYGQNQMQTVFSYLYHEYSGYYAQDLFPTSPGYEAGLYTFTVPEVAGQVVTAVTATVTARSGLIAAFMAHDRVPRGVSHFQHRENWNSENSLFGAGSDGYYGDHDVFAWSSDALGYCAENGDGNTEYSDPPIRGRPGNVVLQHPCPQSGRYYVSVMPEAPGTGFVITINYTVEAIQVLTPGQEFIGQFGAGDFMDSGAIYEIPVTDDQTPTIVFGRDLQFVIWPHYVGNLGNAQFPYVGQDPLCISCYYALRFSGSLAESFRDTEPISVDLSSYYEGCRYHEPCPTRVERFYVVVMYSNPFVYGQWMSQYDSHMFHVTWNGATTTGMAMQLGVPSVLHQQQSMVYTGSFSAAQMGSRLQVLMDGPGYAFADPNLSIEPNFGVYDQVYTETYAICEAQTRVRVQVGGDGHLVQNPNAAYVSGGVYAALYNFSVTFQIAAPVTLSSGVTTYIVVPEFMEQEFTFLPGERAMLQVIPQDGFITYRLYESGDPCTTAAPLHDSASIAICRNRGACTLHVGASSSVRRVVLSLQRIPLGGEKPTEAGGPAAYWRRDGSVSHRAMNFSVTLLIGADRCKSTDGELTQCTNVVSSVVAGFESVASLEQQAIGASSYYLARETGFKVHASCEAALSNFYCQSYLPACSAVGDRLPLCSSVCDNLLATCGAPVLQVLSLGAGVCAPANTTACYGNGEIATTTTSGTGPAGALAAPPAESTDHTLAIVLGVVFGVIGLVGLVVGGVFARRFYKSRAAHQPLKDAGDEKGPAAQSSEASLSSSNNSAPASASASASASKSATASKSASASKSATASAGKTGSATTAASGLKESGSASLSAGSSA